MQKDIKFTIQQIKTLKIPKKALLKTNSYRESNIAKGKTYYVRVRVYRLDSTGSSVHGSFSNVVIKQVKS